MRELQVQKAAAKRMGIENPFFRTHEGLAGARTVIEGKEYLNFSSYNYLGLNGDPRICAAARDAIERYGTSVSASRLVAGERPIHQALEAELARLVGAESCVVFVSGHATNVTVIGQLLGPDDLILYDGLIHNSVTQGALLSRAAYRPFPHNDWRALDRQLSDTRENYDRVLIVIEGLYSMDGDVVPLDRFVELRRHHDTLLMVDEAHSLGVVGPTGRGVSEEFGIDSREIDIYMGTLSKAFAACGGFIAGSADLVELLKFTAPGFVYSVGLAPSLSSAALAAIEIMCAEPKRVTHLRESSLYFVEQAKALGLDSGLSDGYAVIPIMVGSSLKAARLSNALFAQGINVQPILHPAVEERKARLRFFLTYEHTREEIDRALDTTARELKKLS